MERQFAPATCTPLFTGDELCVVERPSASGISVIAFQPWLPDGGSPFPQRATTDLIFARLLETGFHLVLIYQRGNHWYETPELAPALRAARAAANNRDAVTFGLSMGGYGAIAYADALSARAFSMAAQYTIDPTIVPFENRWRHDAAALRFPKNRIRSRSGSVEGVNFIDPLNSSDVLHTKLIESDTRMETFHCPYAGHLVNQHLDGTLGLSELVTAFATRRLSKKRFITRRRAGRRHDRSYMTNLVLQNLRRNRVSAGLAAYEKYLRDKDLDFRKIRLLCAGLVAAGAPKRANEIFCRHARGSPESFLDVYELVRALRILGKTTEANRLLRKGLREYPDAPLLPDLI